MTEGSSTETRGVARTVVDLASAACWTAVIAALLIVQGGIWEHVNSGDLHALAIPWYQYSAHAVLREGRLPLWDPHQFCGTPVLGLGYTAALYPPILALFAALPPWIALQLFYAFHVLVLGWGMTAYLRHHDVGRLPAGIATLLAVATVFRGPLLAGVDRPPFLASVAWIPAILLCWERAAERPGPRSVGWLALALAAPWLPGYPDFALAIPVLLGVMALVSDKGSPRRRFATLLAGLLLSAALVAMQLVPLAEVVAESPRADAGHDVRYRAMFAVLSWEHFERVLSFRFGIAPVALALLGSWPPTRARLAWLAAFLWSIFALNLPFRLLYLFPPYAGVRFPFGWSGASGVFLGILAASGLVGLWHRGTGWARLLAGSIGVAAVAHGLMAVAGAPGSLPGFRPGAAGYRAPDLTLAAKRATQLRDLTGGNDQGDRIVSEREVTSGSPVRYGIPSLTGHSPAAPPRRIVALLKYLDPNLYDALGLYRGRAYPQLATHPELAALLGIGFAVVPQSKAEPLLAAGFSPIGSLPPGDLVLRRPALPRARLVHQTIAASGEDGTLGAVLDAAPRATKVAVVETGALEATLVEPASGTTEDVRILRYDPERVELEAIVAAPALLVLTDTFYPGWHALVDDVAVPILRADHAFRGVRLDAGRHRVIFFYAPASVHAGAVISLAAAGVVLCCLAWPRRRLEASELQGV